MTSEEKKNSKTILEVFRAIENRDQARFGELLDPDFELRWPASLPYGGTSRGLQPKHPTWAETWEPLQPTEAERKMDARVVAANGNDVVVLWRQRGRDPAGNSIDTEVLGLYQFRAGKLGLAQMFYFDTASVASFLAAFPGRPASASAAKP